MFRARISLRLSSTGRLLMLTCAAVALLLSPAFTDDCVVQPDHESIKRFHRELAESKARALQTRRLAETVTSLAPTANQMNYDVKFYDLFISTHYDSQTINGRVGVVGTAEDFFISEVELDFSSNMTVDSVVASSGHLTHTHANDYLTVTLGTLCPREEEFEFYIFYSGNPESCAIFNAPFFDEWNGYPVVNTVSEPWGARCFWPCKDHPTDKPDSMNIAIEVDNQFYVATNGVLDSVVAVDIDRDAYFYRVRYPIATYLFAISIAEFTVFTDWYYYHDGIDSMPVVNHCYPGFLDDAEVGWGIAPDVIGIMADKYGEYPFIAEKYGHTHVTAYGGMEHQTIVGAGANTGEFEERFIVHEVAHHWWGDMITCGSWHDIWLNEGWATYSEALYYQELYGWDYYFSYMFGLAYYGEGTVYCADTTSPFNIFNPYLSYEKGAWVVHMLRGKLGDSLFFAGIDAWSNSEFRYGAATTEDLKNVFESATGVELDAFIDQWVHGEYYPHYHLFQASEPTDSTGYNIYMAVKQVQTTAPEVFEMPVECAFFFEDGSSDTLWFDIDRKKKNFKFVSDSDIIEDGIEIDPRGWLLEAVTIREWDFFIVTPEEELSDGEAEVPYADTLDVFGGSGVQVFLIVEGALPDGFTINSDGIISGVTSESGLFSFRVHAYDLITYESDETDFTIHIEPPWTCCGQYTGGLTGNTNCDEEGLLTLSDITRLIDRVYVSKALLCCEENGNVDASTDGLITLSDITRLIDAVYVSKGPTEFCL